jgi:hypothetical protein
MDVKNVSEAERLISDIKAVIAVLPEPAEGAPEEAEAP